MRGASARNHQATAIARIPLNPVFVCVRVCARASACVRYTVSLLVVGMPPLSSSGAIQRDVPMRRERYLREEGGWGAHESLHSAVADPRGVVKGRSK